MEVTLDALHAGQMFCYTHRKRFNVVQCGRRFGKTKMGLVLACGSAIEGAPVFWGAPTYKYLQDVWREAVAILAPVTARKDTQERRIELITGGAIDFWTLDAPDAGRGRKYRLAVLDECGIVKDFTAIWQAAIRPTLTDLKGDAWMLGTPKGRREFHSFYQRGEQGEQGWACFRMPTASNPIIDKQEIEDARRELPEQIFNQEYLGIPADDGGNPFGMKAIADCFGPVTPAPASVFGVDLAKSQDFTTVFGLSDAGHLVVKERWQAIPWKETRERILRIIGHTPTLVDCTGVGDPIVEELQRAGAIVEGFTFTQHSKQQLMEGLAAGIQTQGVRFDCPITRSELETFEYEYGKTGVRYNAPSGFHDDCVIGLGLAWRHKTMRPTTRIYTHQPKPIVTMTFAERRAADPNYGFGDDE